MYSGDGDGVLGNGGAQKHERNYCTGLEEESK